jgi:hypothetical protein
MLAFRPTPKQQAKRTNNCQKSGIIENDTTSNILHNYHREETK